MAGFLTDAARGSVSTRTVVQVLRHWHDEGVTFDELHAALDHARKSAGSGRGIDHWLERYEKAIRGGLVLSTCCQPNT